MQKISDIFDIKKPKTLTLLSQEERDFGIPFISTSGLNNGRVASVDKNPSLSMYRAGSITVPTNGTILSAFLQPKDCYVAHQIHVLNPKAPMTDREKVYYICAIRANKYRYAYGRKADATLQDIEIPSHEEIPHRVYTADIPDYSDIGEAKSSQKMHLDEKEMREFRLDQLFNIQIGKSYDLNALEQENGSINYIGRTEENNGVITKVQPNEGMQVYIGDCITVPLVGSPMKASYQTQQFCVSQNIAILYAKDIALNPSIALYITTLLKQEIYRYSYGRNPKQSNLKETLLNLPIDSSGKPDRGGMEAYIQGLPFSKYL